MTFFIRFFIFILFPISIMGRPPLYEEEDFYLYYRCQDIDVGLSMLNVLVDIAEENPSPMIFDAMKYEIRRCKAALHGDEYDSSK